MLSLLLLSSSVVGGFAYTVDTSGTRSKPVPSAPVGFKPVWTETIKIVAAASPADRAFSTLMRKTADTLRSNGCGGEAGSPDSNFATSVDAGWLEVDEQVLAASPDIVSTRIDGATYEAGMAHPQPMAARYVNWSRRLRRPLAQDEVLAHAPDLALRRLALTLYDNREGIVVTDFPHGLPLHWDHASIGPAGMTWWFGPYDLGGYPSGGSTTIPWAALTPYLAQRQPFTIATIRAAPGSS